MIGQKWIQKEEELFSDISTLLGLMNLVKLEKKPIGVPNNFNAVYCTGG